MTVPHEMIRASAGSGKTHKLVARIVRLMALGVAPERIAALTFTRNAAAEFLSNALRRLAGAARDHAAAGALSRDIRAERPMEPVEFRVMLRRMVESLHAVPFGTMDSFFARVARAFPLECGLPGTFTVMDAAEQREAVEGVLNALLARRDVSDTARTAFFEAFKQATWGEEGRAVGELVVEFVKERMEAFRSQPNPHLWGGPDVRALVPTEEPERAEGVIQDLEAAIRDSGMSSKKTGHWAEIRGQLEAWRPPMKIPKAMENALGAFDPVAGMCEPFNFKGCKKGVDDAVRQGFARLCRIWLARAGRTAVETASGMARLLAAYEGVHDQTVRRAGRLMFSDFARLLGPVMARREDLAFRMDSRIDHWLLDEFQDTSGEQWRALEPLVDEVLQSGGDRTFFCVGDVKQSIYGWRGGDHRLFGKLEERYREHIETPNLDSSWRSRREVIEFVNAVFGELAGAEGSGGEDEDRWLLRETRRAWGAQWRNHDSAVEGPGHAALLEAAAREEEGAEDDGEKPEHAVVAKLLAQLRPLEAGLSCAVLVQRNSVAAAVAAALRRRFAQGGKRKEDSAAPVPVICNGVIKPVEDSQHGRAALALARVLAHGDDGIASGWLAASPFGEALGVGGAGWRERASWEAHKSGWAAFLGRWWEKAEAGAAWALDAYARDRRARVLRAARLFDERGSADAGRFAAFLEAFEDRAPDSAGAIQVMTVHAAKGLGFDIVIATDLEARGQHLNRPRNEPLRVTRPDGVVAGICNSPAAVLAEKIPALAKGRLESRLKNEFEGLCWLYVALTRAKRGLYAVLPRGKTEDGGQGRAKKSRSVYCGTLLREILGREGGERDWNEIGARVLFERGGVKNLGAGDARGGKAVAAGVGVLGRFSFTSPRRLLPAESPSAHAGAGGVGAVLDPGRVASTALGTAVHDLFADILWAAPDTVADLRRRAGTAEGTAREAFEMAAACLETPEFAALFTPEPGVVAWRERAFVFVREGRRVTGIADRVRIWVDGSGRAAAAEVADFKTDRAEDPSALVEAYRGQLAEYRRALSGILDLDEERIGCVLAAVRARRVMTVFARHGNGQRGGVSAGQNGVRRVSLKGR